MTDQDRTPPAQDPPEAPEGDVGQAPAEGESEDGSRREREGEFEGRSEPDGESEDDDGPDGGSEEDDGSGDGESEGDGESDEDDEDEQEEDEDEDLPPGARVEFASFSWPEGHRSGFVALVGRPNTGKSTLTNAMVGQKVAITSGRPQTTRHAVRGIVHRPEAQIVLVDTPGLHRPRTLLGERLNDVVAETLGDVDAVVVCLPADEPTGPGDRFLMDRLPRGVPAVAAVTKADLVGRAALTARLAAVGAEGRFEHIVPVSAVDGFQVAELADLLVGLLPEGPPLYPAGDTTDEPIETRVAELVREAALEGVRDELPHSLAAVVEEMTRRPGGRTTVVRVDLYVERDSQKGIVIGRGGARLRQVGATARRGIEELLGTGVYLDLHVRVAKDWQRDPRKLRRLGF